MAPDIIKPADRTFQDMPEPIQHSSRYLPHFKGCIGAIDGVHIPVIIPDEEQHPYYNRKGIITTNCMCACDFDMKFTFACVGWERSAHDMRIFLNCLNNESDNFPKAPAGKYYLVDSGYPMRKGFLAPYKGERYHIPEFQPYEVLHRPEERYNYLHSSLRSVIERTFGVWKNKWKILRNMPGKSESSKTSKYTGGTSGHSERGHYDAEAHAISILDEPEMKQVRDNITASICADHN
ncbi:putative nuclease HARBI1 [Quercus lobata]|uniref:putative nuclease HARBI1 n=1 Tax=Quercus lobata TaxID=97700 RepID=UPI001245DD76|nr:putative nuclease HARBI1 [Quercus lobata]